MTTGGVIRWAGRHGPGLWIPAVLVAALGFNWIVDGHPLGQPVEEAAPVVPAEERLSAEAVAQCRDYLAVAQRAGVVAARPDPQRLDVDEARWAAITAREKDLMLQAVACDVWGTAMPPGELDVVSVHGLHTGKQIQALTAYGMVRE